MSKAPAQKTSSGGRKVPVFQILAEDIKAMGVECVFGLMSDDTALFATALDTVGVRLYGARHENTAIATSEIHFVRPSIAATPRPCCTARGSASSRLEHASFMPD